MFRKLVIPFVLTLLVLALARCAPAAAQPTPGGVPDTGAGTESIVPTPPQENTPGPETGERTPEAFLEEVLAALSQRDPAEIQALMGESFFYGWWRWEKMDQAPADAVQDLLTNNLSPDSSLSVASDVDLGALMGGEDPASIPGPQVDVVKTALVTGWGLDGRDEAILYIARNPDGNLYWHGALVVQGGFTSPQTGGVQLLTNEEHGYSLWYPKGYEVQQPNEQEIVIHAPATTEGHRERALISVEPAGGRTVEQVVEELISEMQGFEISQTITIVDGEPAMILDNVPGQDLNRQVLVVHEDRLYRMMFVPSDPEQGQAYEEMETVFGPVINTFQFLPLAPGATQPAGDATADLQAFRERLFGALEQRDKGELQALMGDKFTFGYWLSEGVVVSPSEAVEQLLNNFLGPEPQLAFDTEKDLAEVLNGMEPSSLLGPDVPLIQAIFVSGWGLEGMDEAILFISEDQEGRLYWHSVLIAQGGFSGSTSPA